MNRHEVESGAHGAEPPLERRAEALAVLGFESIRVGLSDGLWVHSALCGWRRICESAGRRSGVGVTGIWIGAGGMGHG